MYTQTCIHAHAYTHAYNCIRFYLYIIYTYACSQFNWHRSLGMNQRLQPFTIENDLQHFYAPAAPTFHVFLIPHPHLDIAIARRYFGWYMYIEKINAHTHIYSYIHMYISISYAIPQIRCACSNAVNQPSMIDLPFTTPPSGEVRYVFWSW